MILAGGLSTRLYPLTKQVPKPLVPVAGVANAIHVIRYLVAYGCNEIAINVHYLAGDILRSLGDGSKFGVRLTYLHEMDLLGSAGAVKEMEDFLSRGTFVVVGCDDLTDIPLDEVVRFHEKHKAIATIGLVECSDVEHYGVVLTDRAGKITGFQEKPAKGTELSNRANTGIYVFGKQIFQHIPPGAFCDFGKDVFPALQRASLPFYGFDAHGSYWCDIGTPDEYRRATNDVLSGRFRIPQTRAKGTDPSAQIANSDYVYGDVWIGARASLAPGARVYGPSVIGDDVQIGAGARLERAIIWQGASIGENAVLRDTIVGIHYAVEASAVLDNAIVANEEGLVETT